MCTVRVIQQMSTNCVHTNDDGAYILPNINLYLSLRQSTHPDSFFLSLCIYGEFRIYKDSVLKDQEFFYFFTKHVKKKRGAPSHYGAGSG